MQKEQKCQELQDFRGSGWTKLNEAFIRDTAKALDSIGMPVILTENEKLSMLVLLLNSTKRSINRVKDRSKPAYYGKPHQWKNPHDMVLSLIYAANFLRDFAIQFTIFCGKNHLQAHRPTLGRIDHDNGYTLDNIQVEARGYNSGEAKSKPCLSLISIDGVLTILDSPSIDNSIARMNELFVFGISRNKLKGNLEHRLFRNGKDYSIVILSKNILKEQPNKIVILNEFMEVEIDSTVTLISISEIKTTTNQLWITIDDMNMIHLNIVETSADEDLGSKNQESEIEETVVGIGA